MNEILEKINSGTKGPLGLEGEAGIIAAAILGAAIGFVLMKSRFADRKTVMNQLALREGTFFKVIFASLACGAILFHFASKTGFIVATPPKTFFWAAEIGGMIFALGLALSGFTPSNALASAGAGRIYSIWAIAGMLAAIPFVHFTGDFLAETVYRWPTPLECHDTLSEQFSNPDFYLWLAGISAVFCVFFEFMPGGDEKKE